MYAKLFALSSTKEIVGAFNWFTIGNEPFGSTINFELGIKIDNITALMLFVVNLISMLVHIFSIAYMKGDKRYTRYFAYLGIFTFSMLGIVLTHNLLMMYIFWELVGLSSYLLIGFWFEKPSAANASKKAFLVNRIGDIGMFLGILILFTNYHTFTFDVIFAQIKSGVLPFGSYAWLTASGILIFLGAVGKSAQFPLHVWLPDAMEGPTPVSALIHAATMVAAGVYLVTRIFVMLTSDAMLFIAIVGAFTSLNCCYNSTNTKRYQKSFGIFNRISIGIHGYVGRRRRLRFRILPFSNTRISSKHVCSSVRVRLFIQCITNRISATWAA